MCEQSTFALRATAGTPSWAVACAHVPASEEVVPGTGVEPARVAPPAPKTGVSAIPPPRLAGFSLLDWLRCRDPVYHWSHAECYHPAFPMHTPTADSFFGLFDLQNTVAGQPHLTPTAAPAAIPDPQTGRPLTVAAVDVSVHGVCPACTQFGAGAYVSFVADLRLAFACPNCRTIVWMNA